MSPFRCFLIGSDSLLANCAEVLIARGHNVRGIITQAPVIQHWASERGIRVVDQTQGYINELAAEPFDYLLSITNLSVVPDDALTLPKIGAVNFHDGPLPRYGGLQSPAWALMAGEHEHGITWHEMTGAVDEGNILVQRRFPIHGDDTSLTLNAKCFETAIDSFPDLIEVLEQGVTAGALTGTPHTLDRATYHGPAHRPDNMAVLNWNRPVAELSALIRALDFGAYGNPLACPKIVVNHRAVIVRGVAVHAPDGSSRPGQVLSATESEVHVAGVDGSLVLSSFATIDGALLTGTQALTVLGVSPGDILPVAFNTNDVAAINGEAHTIARNERYWVDQLKRCDVLPVPGALLSAPGAPGTRVDPVRSPAHPVDTGAPGYADVVLSDSDNIERSVALFVLALAKLSARTSFDIGYRQTRTLPPAMTSLCAANLPLNVDLSTGDSVADSMARITAAVASLTARGTYTRDLVLRHPDLARFAGNPPTFDIRIERVAHFADISSDPAALIFAVDQDGRQLLRYDANSISGSAIAEFAAQLATLRSADPSLNWVTVPLLTQEARVQLAQWGNGEHIVAPGVCLHRQFEAQVQRTPNATALICDDVPLSFAELNTRANQLARHLQKLGARPDTLIGLCCHRTHDMVVGMLGILKSSAAYVPLDPEYPHERLAYMMRDAQVRILVTQESVLSATPLSAEHIVRLDRDHNTIAGEAETDLDTVDRPEQLAYCIYTSGSTGQPKGVMVEHRNVEHFFLAMDARLGTEPGTWLAVTSMSFDISVLELCWTLTRGFTVVLYAPHAKPATRLDIRNSAVPEMDFSLFFFSADAQSSGGDRYRLLMESARFGDANGFAAVWTPERHFHAFGGLYPNPAVTGAAIAAVTTRIGVRAGSCVLPLHHPIRVVEEWSVVDNLSNGRVGISFAAGWQPDDFVLQPDNYANAKQRLVEQLDTVQRLWRGETMSFDGPRGPVAVQTLPRPIQQELPVWFTTAGNPESFTLAGRLGVNILTHLLGQTVAELADKLVLYHQAWTEAGHSGRGQVALMIHTFVGDDDAEVKAAVREPMKAYLATSISLIKGYAAAFPTFKRRPDGTTPELDFNSLTPEEMDALLEYSFERYYTGGGLFGTVHTCAEIVADLKRIGVDEIACLVDFGVDDDVVLKHLHHLNQLRMYFSGTAAALAPAAAADQTLSAQIIRHGVTHVQCTPSMAGMMVADPENHDAIRQIGHWLIGGEAFPAALAATIQDIGPAHVHNMYGPTETTIWSAMHTLRGHAESIPLGAPLPNNELMVLDAFGQLVPPGAEGELYIGGAQVVRGYWQRPELTAERFVPHPSPGTGNASGTASDRLYRTGDLVRWRRDGVLEFLGRTDHQVKVRGYRIELGEIEATIASLPYVREAVVVAHQRHADIVDLVAFVVWSSGTSPVDIFPDTASPGSAERRTAQLRKDLRSRLPDFMIPTLVVERRDLPRTPNAKIDRKALMALDAWKTPAPAVAPAQLPVAPILTAPHGTIEETIGDVWRDVLQLSNVGVNDNFFDIGGHSLLAVQVHSRLKRTLGVEVSITDLFRYPTIRTLATALGRGQQAADVSDNESALSGTARAAQRREMAGRRSRRLQTP
jgi:natural product biosynthesis luciferase-like monooxygenase protein